MLFAVHVLVFFAIYKVYKVIKAEDNRHPDKPATAKSRAPNA